MEMRHSRDWPWVEVIGSQAGYILEGGTLDGWDMGWSLCEWAWSPKMGRGHGVLNRIYAGGWALNNG